MPSITSRQTSRTEVTDIPDHNTVTVSKVAEVINGSEPPANGARHIVLDLRGLTFMDVSS